MAALRTSIGVLLAFSLVACGGARLEDGASDDPAPAARPGSPRPVAEDDGTAAAGPQAPSNPTSLLGGMRVNMADGTTTGSGSTETPAPAPGTTEWSRAHGAAGDDAATAVAVDADANVVMAGWSSAGADLGCGAHANDAAYVAKYAPAGDCLWATYFEATDLAAAAAVAVDGAGDVFVTGAFGGSLTVAGSSVPAIESAGGLDGWVAKLDASGSVAWTKPFGGDDDEYVYALAIHGQQIAIGGAYYAADTAGDADAFVTELAASDGAPGASRTFGGVGWDSVNALATDGAGRLVVAGTFYEAIDLGEGVVTGGGSQDGFVFFADASLATVAARTYGGAGDDSASALAIDAAGHPLVAGYVTAGADLGAGPIACLAGHAGFVARYDAALAPASVSLFDGDADVVPDALSAAPGGGFVVTGRFTGTAAFGASELSAEEGAAFVASFGASGAASWARSFGGASAEALAVSVGSSGAMAVGGVFGDSIDLGGSATSSAGEEDLFVARMAL
jgi:hypothetical protein